MAWESRNGHGRYYTRSRKQNGRVVREYVGTGLLGDMAFQNDVHERAHRKEQRERFLSEKMADREMDIALTELDRFLGAAATGDPRKTIQRNSTRF